MKDCTEIFDAQAKTVHTHCLGLVTEKRTYYIAAETKDEITKWLEVKPKCYAVHTCTFLSNNAVYYVFMYVALFFIFMLKYFCMIA